MKYIVIVGDGMADRPLQELGGKTPLQVAHKPHIDALAKQSKMGMIQTIPLGLPPGSDVGALSILGYNPHEFLTGRAPLEAAASGIDLKPDEVAFRCNLVTLSSDKVVFSPNTQEFPLMEDYSAGNIDTQEAKALIECLQQNLSNEEIQFHPGVGYRHLMVWKGGSLKLSCTPPHDIPGQPIGKYLPFGPAAEKLWALQTKAAALLAEHPVNLERKRKGQKPANSVWFWGQGRRPTMPTFKEKYGMEGCLVSAVDLSRGIGRLLGLEVLKVPGMTGYLDTNYVGKAQAAMYALKEVDFAYIHVEAPDEAGHKGKVDDKIKAIEDIDTFVVAEVLKQAKTLGAFRLLLLADHATPVGLKVHTSEAVPFLLFDSLKPFPSPHPAYDELVSHMQPPCWVENGFELMAAFLEKVAVFPEKNS
ncbi:MAG: cofactor-independent phosphoglycerate mutase [Cystobacterineae bacterium]|nr:cofactor-independent phosphoglycerate mutase [Cystobacterineae bacterium]